MNVNRQQRGGTFLGFILGLLVGLGAALAVAVYVTKMPIPFVNKNTSRSAEQDAAEASKNKDWNPNAALSGKNPPPAAGAPNAVTPAVPAAVTPAMPKASAPAKTDARPASADPLGELAKAKSATAGADPFSYLVQVGAFRNPEDAESQRAKLSLMGVEAKVTEREQSGRMVYRVRVGPFDGKEQAELLKEKLEAAGVETALVRVQR